MFFKGSRYKDLPEIHAVNPEGQATRSKTLRWIPDTPGSFLHTVNQSERLDLLSYKYYSNPKKWWLICDANPEFAFPPDLLDQSPLLQETFYIIPIFVVPHYPVIGFGFPIFHTLSSFSTLSAYFSIRYVLGQRSWPILIRELKSRRGIHKVLADAFQGTLDVIYNQKEIKQEEIIMIINSNGFVVNEIVKKERIGQKIIIPPNKVF